MWAVPIATFLDRLWAILVLAVLIGVPVAVIGAAVIWRRRNGSRRGLVVIGLAPIVGYVALVAVADDWAWLAVLPACAGILVLLSAPFARRRLVAEAPMGPPN